MAWRSVERGSPVAETELIASEAGRPGNPGKSGADDNISEKESS